MTIPLEDVPLRDQQDWVCELADLGYTDAWSSENSAADAFTPLVLASTWAPGLTVGSAIAGTFRLFRAS